MLSNKERGKKRRRLSFPSPLQKMRNSFPPIERGEGKTRGGGGGEGEGETSSITTQDGEKGIQMKKAIPPPATSYPMSRKKRRVDQTSSKNNQKRGGGKRKRKRSASDYPFYNLLHEEREKKGDT